MGYNMVHLFIVRILTGLTRASGWPGSSIPDKCLIRKEEWERFFLRGPAVFYSGVIGGQAAGNGRDGGMLGKDGKLSTRER
jgi:hypothetical protein